MAETRAPLSSLVNRWAMAQARAGARVPPQVMVILGAIVERYNAGEGQARPGYQTLADDTGCSIDTVTRGVQQAEKLGAITVTRHQGRGLAAEIAFTPAVWNAPTLRDFASQDRAPKTPQASGVFQPSKTENPATGGDKTPQTDPGKPRTGAGPTVVSTFNLKTDNKPAPPPETRLEAKGAEEERVFCPLCSQPALVRESKEYPPALVKLGYPHHRMNRGWYCGPRKGGCGETFPVFDERITAQLPEHVLLSLERQLQERRKLMFGTGESATTPEPVRTRVAQEPEADALVEQMLEHISRDVKVSRYTFATWFRPLAGLDVQGGVLRIMAPNQQFLDWLNNNYHQVLARALEVEGITEFEILSESEYDFQRLVSAEVEQLLLDARRPHAIRPPEAAAAMGGT